MKKLGAYISSLCLVATWFAGTAVAQRDAGLNFYAEPAPGSSVQDGYYVIEADPGDTFTQELILRNDSKDTIALGLYPSDGTTSVFGGADYTMPDVELTRVGTWIALQRDTVRLKPKRQAKVTFRVRVPSDAPTGEHLGGISIFPIEKPKDPGDVNQEGNGAGAQVVVEYRRVIAVQVNTPGKAEPRLMISGIRPTARPDGAYVDVNIANEGTALTTGEGTIEIPGLDYKRSFSLDTFVPSSEIYYPVRVDDSLPTGEHEASVRIEYDEGDKVVEWTDTFSVGDDLLRELAERGAPGAHALTTRGNLVPWAAVFVAAMMALMAWRRMRQPAEVAVPAGPAPLGSFSIGEQVTEEKALVAAPETIAEVTTPEPESVPSPSPARYVVTSAAPVVAPGNQAPPVRTSDASPTETAPPGDRIEKSTTEKTLEKKTPEAPKKASAKKTPAKKATVRGTAKKSSAKKTGAKTTSAAAPASKTPAKKTAAKKSTRRSAIGTTGTKKAPAKKTSARKTSAARTSANKTTAKKVPAKKTGSKKATARKATKRSSASKASAKETTAGTAAGKRSTAKSTKKKTTVRRTPKESSAKKTAARRTPVRKAS